MGGANDGRVILAVIALAMVGIDAALFAWQVYFYLAYGQWHWFTIVETIEAMGGDGMAVLKAFVPTGWIGVDKIIVGTFANWWAGTLPSVIFVWFLWAANSS